MSVPEGRAGSDEMEKKHCRPLLAQGIEQIPVSPQRQSHPDEKGGASRPENLCGKGTHRGVAE